MTTKKTATPKSRPVRSSAGDLGDVNISFSSTAKKTNARNVSVGSRPVTVEFGSVTVHVLAPSKTTVRRNIKAGQFALERATKGLARSGVKIKVSAGIPMFHTDPARPDHLVREINGVREFGKFVGGTFRAVR